MFQLDQRAAFRRRIQQTAARADHCFRRSDDLLADRVNRRVRDLREQLLEIIVKQLRLVRQNRQRRVRAHRTERLNAVVSHRPDDKTQILERVAERLLPLQNFAMIRLGRICWLRQIFQMDMILIQPLLIRLRAGVFFLQFLVRNNPALFSVHQKHSARLKRPFCKTRSGATGKTPASDAMMTRSSFVT